MSKIHSDVQNQIISREQSPDCSYTWQSSTTKMPAGCFTSLCDSGWQAGVDVLSMDVQPSVEFMTRLLPHPVQVAQQLSQPHRGGFAQVPELHRDRC